MNSGVETKRESKHLQILGALGRLRMKVEALEDLSRNLAGAPFPPGDESLKQATTPFFSQVFNSLSSSIDDITERIDRATSELRDLLL